AAIDGGAEAGARQALGAAAARYGLSEPLPPDQIAAATAEQIAGHCDAIPEATAARMVEAQRLRDAAFADAALRARAYASDGRVVLIAGSGHARRDRAVPAKLRAADPGLDVATLALVEVAAAEDWRAYLGPDADAPPFDYLWFTARPAREDPCEAFLRGRAVP
ncbi:MAG: ChaN family lipoprotein, partial [Rubrimonas sp.]